MAISGRQMVMDVQSRYSGNGLDIAAQRTEMLQRSLSNFASGMVLKRVGIVLEQMGKKVVGLAEQGLKASFDFQKQMNLVQTQADLTTKGFNKLSNAARDIARNSGLQQSLPQVTKGFYDLYSSVTFAGDGIKQATGIMQLLSRAAVAGNSDIATVGRGVIAMNNAFGRAPTIKNYTEALDIQFQMVKLGVGTYNEFATQLGQILPAARRSGQSLNTMAGAFAFATRQGMNTAMASVSVARAMDLLARPKVIEGVKKVFGVDIVNPATKQFNSLKFIIDGLAKSMEGLTGPQRIKAMTDAFGKGDIRALRFLSAATANVKDLNFMLEHTGSPAVLGAMEKAFGIMEKSPSFKLAQDANKWHDALIDVGRALTPLATKVLDFVGKALDDWHKLNDETKGSIVRFVAFSGVFLIVGGALLTVIGSLKMFISLMQLANATMVNMGVESVGILGPVVGILALLAAGFFYIRSHMEQVRKWAKMLADDFHKLWDVIKPQLVIIGGLFYELASVIFPVFVAVLHEVLKVLTFIAPALSTIVIALTAMFILGKVSALWAGFMAFLTAAPPVIATAAEGFTAAGAAAAGAAEEFSFAGYATIQAAVAARDAAAMQASAMASIVAAENAAAASSIGLGAALTGLLARFGPIVAAVTIASFVMGNWQKQATAGQKAAQAFLATPGGGTAQGLQKQIAAVKSQLDNVRKSSISFLGQNWFWSSGKENESRRLNAELKDLQNAFDNISQIDIFKQTFAHGLHTRDFYMIGQAASNAFVSGRIAATDLGKAIGANLPSLIQTALAFQDLWVKQGAAGVSTKSLADLLVAAGVKGQNLKTILDSLTGTYRADILLNIQESVQQTLNNAGGAGSQFYNRVGPGAPKVPDAQMAKWFGPNWNKITTHSGTTPPLRPDLPGTGTTKTAKGPSASSVAMAGLHSALLANQRWVDALSSSLWVLAHRHLDLTQTTAGYTKALVQAADKTRALSAAVSEAINKHLLPATFLDRSRQLAQTAATLDARWSDLNDRMKTFSKSITDLFADIGQLSGLTGALSASDVPFYFNQQVTLAQNLNDTLMKLQQRGLNQNLIGQLVAMSPTDALKVGNLLLQSNIPLINKQVQQISQLGIKTAQSLTDKIFGPEVNALRKQTSAFIAALNALIRSINSHLPVKQRIPVHQAGGIATSARMGIWGDVPQGEALIPLNQRGAAFVAAAFKTAMGMSPTSTTSGGEVHLHFYQPNWTPRKIVEEVEWSRRTGRW